MTNFKIKDATIFIKNAEKILYKIRYGLEFIFSLIATFGTYKLFTIKHYSGYFDKNYLAISIMYIILTIAIAIYCCYKDKKSIEKIFLTFMIPVGMLYLVFVIPSHVPDEHAHMWKAYEVSTGKLVTEIKEDGSSPISIPSDLLKYVNNNVEKYSSMIGKLKENTDYTDMVQVTSSAQNYSFVLYIGSALGFLISRAFHLNILIGIYFGKIFNFILFLIVGYYTIKNIPFGKLLVATFLFIPMMLHQAISFSADAITNMVTIFFIVYVLKLILQENKLTKKQIILLALLSILVGVVKVAYVPLLGLSMMLLFKKDLTKKQKVIISITVIVGVIAALAMYVLSMQYIGLSETSGYGEENNVNSSQQIHYILENPIGYLKVLKNDWLNNGLTYIEMAIGSRLGWLNIGIEQTTITAFIIVLLFAMVAEKNNKVLTNKQRLWTIFISVLSVVLIETVLYISWSGVGSRTISGIQGRYFIPIVILTLLSICMKDNYLKFKNINIKILMIVSLLNVLVIKAIYGFFI